MRVLFHSQHVLGMGHLFRSLELARALTHAGHEVLFVTGGEDADLPLPDNVTHYRLSPLRMDRDFSRLMPVNAPAGVTTADVFTQRERELAALIHRAPPHLFISELFPFGRKRFGPEILAAIALCRSAVPTCRAACSVRDILVEKADHNAFAARVLGHLAAYDAILVHSDPDLIRLEETFPSAGSITIPVHHTGHIAVGPTAGAGREVRRQHGIAPETPLIVACVGGGNVGEDLLAATLDASALLQQDVPHQLAVFTGPFMAQRHYDALAGRAASMPWVQLSRFTPDLPAWLDAAELAVCMGGYNTTMNLLATGTFGLVHPFAQNREQHMRATRLAQRDLLGVLEADDLRPEALCQRMASALTTSPPDHGLRLDGATTSARILTQLMQNAKDAG